MSERTLDQIREHYEIETELANRLRTSTKEERKKLYSIVYDELFTRVSHHPMNDRKLQLEETNKYVQKRLRLLKPYLSSSTVYLEVGAGDCHLAFQVARQVKKAYAVEVSAEIANNQEKPSNFELVITDGTNIPVLANSIDIAFSDQLMEHLHPDDALEQLSNIHTALAPGGRYICFTPSAFSGPHDVSKYFDDVAKGLHMCEYTNTDLARLFQEAGFKKIRVLIGLPYLNEASIFPFQVVERLLNFLPRSINRKLARTSLFKLLGTGNLRVIGIK